MSYRFALPILAVLFAGLPAAAQVATAFFKGAILDELGRPLAGARVVYTWKPRNVPGRDGRWRNAPGELQFSSQVTSDASGRYQTPQLPAGDYYLCIVAPGYLATCDWTGWQRATLAQGQGLDNGAVKLTKAITITIRIDDPLSLLKASNTIASPLVVGVRERWGRMHPGREMALNDRTHVFQVDVPSETPLNIWLHSWRFLLTDSTGSAINRRGAQFPFQVAAGGTAPTFVFTITGEARP